MILSAQPDSQSQIVIYRSGKDVVLSDETITSVTTTEKEQVVMPADIQKKTILAEVQAIVEIGSVPSPDAHLIPSLTRRGRGGQPWDVLHLRGTKTSHCTPSTLSFYITSTVRDMQTGL